MKKRLRVILGPNGAGKSTVYRTLKDEPTLSGRQDIKIFINADEIQVNWLRGKSIQLLCSFTREELLSFISNTTFSPEIKALFSKYEGCFGENKVLYRAPLEQLSYLATGFADFVRHLYVKNGISFIFETVFSYPGKIEFLQKALENDYQIYSYFIATEAPELNVERVKQRVKMGGHDVPVPKIIDRYKKSLSNFYSVMELSYRSYFWDNSTKNAICFAELSPDRKLSIYSQPPIWFDKYILNH